MRSGYDRDARYLMFDGGPLGSGHYHQDKLNLVMYAYGKPLLLEAGNYSYDASRARRYAISTRAHNTVRVDDQNQKDTFRALPKPWDSPLPDNLWLTNEDVDYVRSSYSDGYGGDRQVKVVHTRSILFVRPEYWVVFDALDPEDAEEHSYEVIWHINAATAQMEPKTLSVTSRDTNETNLQLWPVTQADWTVDIVKGRTEEPVQGWVNYPMDYANRKWVAVPTALYQRRAAGPQRIATVVYPIASGRSSPIRGARELPVTSAEGQPLSDASALEIQFQNGRRHQILHATRDGVLRSVSGVQTDQTVLLRELDAAGRPVKQVEVTPPGH